MYSSFIVGAKTFSLAHLNPQNISVKIDNYVYDVLVEFGCHCFTDEKNNGPFYREEGNHVRYWSQVRYNDSLNLPIIINNILTKLSCYVVPFKSKETKKEQYNYIDNGYYAIFFYINSIDIIAKTMKIYIVSAYDKSTYVGNLPKGKAYKLSWVLSKRIAGEFILK